MALNKESLSKDIAEVLKAASPDVMAGPIGMAKAYSAYASKAKSCAQGSPTLTAINTKTLESLLAMAALDPNPANAPTSQSAAYLGFWTLPIPVLFSGGGIMTPPLSPILESAIKIIVSLPPVSGTSIEDIAEKWATALDIFTKTIIVTHTAPACAGPVT